jgi:RNA polymerase sigma factor (sigma-70 family)
MADALPNELVGLLNATDPAAREVAWASFVKSHSRLLLHVARTVNRNYDAAMDAYAYLLEQLRADDCHRLRGYAADGRSKFTTWLVVVARRLCLDHFRHQYGRPRGESGLDGEGRATRRRLVDLLAEHTDLDAIPDVTDPGPDAEVMAAERSRCLAVALGRLVLQDRVLLKFRFEDDLSAREIAALMGFATPFHVYRRLNALFEQLRVELSRRGVEGPPP